MPRYAITISLQAERLPELQPERFADPEADPGAELLKMAGKMMSTIAPPGGGVIFHRPSGMNVSKNIEISVESFLALAEVLGKFDHLAEVIECEHPSRE